MVTKYRSSLTKKVFFFRMNFEGVFAVKRSKHNTTYFATSSQSKYNPGQDEDCRLYEYDDSGTSVSVTNHIVRGTDQWDMPAMSKGVDVADDNTVFFAYTLNVGFMNDLDSWMMIERLDDPGKDVLNIRTGLRDARVVVYDLNGRLVHSQTITEHVTAIDAGGWGEGIYVWKVMANGKEVEIGKWVKK